jgi:hypothetical protein
LTSLKKYEEDQIQIENPSSIQEYNLMSELRLKEIANNIIRPMKTKTRSKPATLSEVSSLKETERIGNHLDP